MKWQYAMIYYYYRFQIEQYRHSQIPPSRLDMVSIEQTKKQFIFISIFVSLNLHHLYPVLLVTFFSRTLAALRFSTLNELIFSLYLKSLMFVCMCVRYVCVCSCNKVIWKVSRIIFINRDGSKLFFVLFLQILLNKVCLLNISFCVLLFFYEICFSSADKMMLYYHKYPPSPPIYFSIYF